MQLVDILADINFQSHAMSAFEIGSLLGLESPAAVVEDLKAYCMSKPEEFTIHYVARGIDRADGHVVMVPPSTLSKIEARASQLDDVSIFLHSVGPAGVEYPRRRPRQHFGFKLPPEMLTKRVYPLISRQDTVKSLKSQSSGALSRSPTFDLSLNSAPLPIATARLEKQDSQPKVMSQPTPLQSQLSFSAPKPEIKQQVEEVVITSQPKAVEKPKQPTIIIEDKENAAPVKKEREGASPTVIAPKPQAKQAKLNWTITPKAPAPASTTPVLKTAAETSAPANPTSVPIEVLASAEHSRVMPIEAPQAESVKAEQASTSSPASSGEEKKPSAFDIMKKAAAAKPVDASVGKKRGRPKKEKADGDASDAKVARSENPDGTAAKRGRKKKEQPKNSLAHGTVKKEGTKAKAGKDLVDDDDSSDDDSSSSSSDDASQEQQLQLPSVNDEIELGGDLPPINVQVPPQATPAAPAVPAPAKQLHAASAVDDASPGAKRPRAAPVVPTSQARITAFSNPALVEFQKGFEKTKEMLSRKEGDEYVFEDVTRYREKATGKLFTPEEYKAMEAAVKPAVSASPAATPAVGGGAASEPAAASQAEEDVPPKPKRTNTNPVAAANRKPPSKCTTNTVAMKPLTSYFTKKSEE